MKIKIDKPTLNHVMFFCNNAESMQFDNRLITFMVHEQLCKLGEKCQRKAQQEKMSIKVTAAELLALHTITEAVPSASSMIIKEYVINPLLKQL